LPTLDNDMRILQKYVLREFLLPFCYCFATFYGLYVLSTFFGTFQKMHLANPSTGTIIHYFIAYMSPYVVWLLPASLMLAALYTMWRFCHHGEIVAMRANGLSYTTVVAPMLGVAVVMTLICAINQEFYAPQGCEFARRLENSNFKPFPPDISEVSYNNYAEHRVWHITKMNRDNPHLLEGVRITMEYPNGKKQVDISCRAAEYLDGVWWLQYPQYRYFDENGNPTESPSNPLLSLNTRAMPQFTERPRDFSNERKSWEFFSLRDMLSYLRAHPYMPPKDRTSHLYDVHSRVAMPWACVVITLFAIPAGVATGRQSVFRGVLMAIGLFFFFYAATYACLFFCKRGALPTELVMLAAWLPNMVFLGAGITLFSRLR